MTHDCLSSVALALREFDRHDTHGSCDKNIWLGTGVSTQECDQSLLGLIVQKGGLYNNTVNFDKCSMVFK